MKKKTLPTTRDIKRQETVMRNGARQEGSTTKLKMRADQKREPKE